MTLAELKRLKTFRVTKRFTGQYHAGNHHELRADLVKKLAERGIPESELKETEGFFMWDNRSVFKPKILKEDTGTVTVKSSGAYFFVSDTTGRKSHGDAIKAMNTTKDGFMMPTMDGNFIIYTIIKEEK